MHDSSYCWRFDKIMNFFLRLNVLAKPRGRPLFIIPRKNSQTFICILSRERQNAERGIIKQRNCLVWTIYWILSYGNRVVGYFRSPRVRNSLLDLSQRELERLNCSERLRQFHLWSNCGVHFWRNRYRLLNCSRRLWKCATTNCRKCV